MYTTGAAPGEMLFYMNGQKYIWQRLYTWSDCYLPYIHTALLSVTLFRTSQEFVLVNNDIGLDQELHTL